MDEMSEQTSQRISIECADGYSLRGHLFEPSAAVASGATVIVCAAIFVRERYYARFAAYLAGRGYRVVTFSNRGADGSLGAEARGRKHPLRDWGERDLPAVVGYAHSSSPEDKLYVVGHSMGGQLVALSRSVHVLDGIVTVAATSAWWGHWPFPVNIGILAWYSAIPLVVRGLRVFPAERFGLGPDVESSLVRDWARWGRDRRYLFGPFGMHPEMASYRGRVLALSFTDDRRLGCRRAVDDLHQHYVRADMSRRHVDPAEVGVEAIGHFGFFRLESGNRLWEGVVDWLEDENASIGK